MMQQTSVTYRKMFEGRPEAACIPVEARLGCGVGELILWVTH